MITFLDFHLSYIRSSLLLATKDSYKNGGIPVDKNLEYKFKQMQNSADFPSLPAQWNPQLT